MKLICYLSNGYPDIESSKKIAKIYEEAGCDMIELDFPSRDPFLEGEFIAERMARALENCDDYEAYLEGMADLAVRQPDTDFILMAYENTIEEIGTERLLTFCQEHGFKDMILVGPKNEEIKDRLMAGGIRISCYVRFGMRPIEIEYAKKSNGFVYLQAKAPADEVNPLYPELGDCIRHLREEGIKAPIYCGVGIHTVKDVEMARRAGADAVFVGNAVMKLHDNPQMLADTIRGFKKACTDEEL